MRWQAAAAFEQNNVPETFSADLSDTIACLMVLSYDECFLAAENVIDALSNIGETWCCFVGGMAAKLHGVSRHVKVRSTSKCEFIARNSLIGLRYCGPTARQ